MQRQSFYYRISVVRACTRKMRKKASYVKKPFLRIFDTAFTQPYQPKYIKFGGYYLGYYPGRKKGVFLDSKKMHYPSSTPFDISKKFWKNVQKKIAKIFGDLIFFCIFPYRVYPGRTVLGKSGDLINRHFFPNVFFKIYPMILQTGFQSNYPGRFIK